MGLQFGPSILGAKIVVDDRPAMSAFGRLKTGLGGARENFRGFGAEVSGLKGSLMSVVGPIAAITGSAAGLSFGVGSAVRNFASFETGIAKIGTLLPAGSNAMAMYGDAVLNLSQQFGMSAESIAEGLFQAVSASVPAEKATRFLDVAAKASVGGFTSMTTAVDGLTTVLNAYGLKTGYAEDVSDAFFVANRLGKTTFEELARTLGNVVPIAAAVGVGYEDVSSAIASVTKQGIRTSEVTTGLRQAMASILKPSEEAKELAKKLGLQFNESGLRAQGFGKFMQGVSAATGGSASRMVKLFGSVEAANIVMALTSRTGLRDFNSALAEMQKTSGQTGEAFGVVSQTAGKKWDRFAEQVRAASIKIGGAIAHEAMPYVEDLGERLTKWVPKAVQSLRDFIDDVKEYGKVLLDVLEKVLIFKGIGLINKFSTAAAASLGAIGGAFGSGGTPSGSRDEKGRFLGSGGASKAGRIADKIGQIGMFVQAAYITAQAGFLIGEHVMPSLLRSIGIDPVGNAQRDLAVSKAANLMGAKGEGFALALAAGAREGNLNWAKTAHLKNPGALGYTDQIQANRVMQALVEEIQRKVATTEKGWRWERAKGYDALAGRNVETTVPRDVMSIRNDVVSLISDRLGAIIAEVKLADQTYLDAVLEVIHSLMGGTSGLPAVLEGMRTALEAQSELMTDVRDGFFDAFKWFGSELKIKLDHTIKDKDKGRDHAVRASRGDGVARHLNPRYRVTILRGGAAAGIIEPLAENYHAPHLINGGG